jgi:hypothetical protein
MLATGEGQILFEHDPEKWQPVFRKDYAPTKKMRALIASI